MHAWCTCTQVACQGLLVQCAGKGAAAAEASKAWRAAYVSMPGSSVVQSLSVYLPRQENAMRTCLPSSTRTRHGAMEPMLVRRRRASKSCTAGGTAGSLLKRLCTVSRDVARNVTQKKNPLSYRVNVPDHLPTLSDEDRTNLRLKYFLAPSCAGNGYCRSQFFETQVPAMSVSLMGDVGEEVSCLTSGLADAEANTLAATARASARVGDDNCMACKRRGRHGVQHDNPSFDPRCIHVHARALANTLPVCRCRRELHTSN